MPELPNSIQQRIDQLDSEIERVIEVGSSHLKTDLTDETYFHLRHSAPLPFPDKFLSAQSMGFVIRYEQLPADYQVTIFKYQGRYHIENMDFVRHVLSDFRPLVWNRRDSVYYTRIHSSWYKLLKNDDPARGGSLRAKDATGADITDLYKPWLSERKKAIGTIVEQLDFDYLYNGVLQHSDPRHSDRFVRDYVSGELNYILWKHMAVLGIIRDLLAPYHRMINAIAFPKRGGL